VKVRNVNSERSSVFFPARVLLLISQHLKCYLFPYLFRIQARSLAESIDEYQSILALLKEMLAIALFLADNEVNYRC